MDGLVLLKGKGCTVGGKTMQSERDFAWPDGYLPYARILFGRVEGCEAEA